MEHFDDLNELLGDRPASAVVGLDTTVVETMFAEDFPVGEMMEEFLDESISECDELPQTMATSQRNRETVPKKKSRCYFIDTYKNGLKIFLYFRKRYSDNFN